MAKILLCLIGLFLLKPCLIRSSQGALNETSSHPVNQSSQPLYTTPVTKFTSANITDANNGQTTMIPPIPMTPTMDSSFVMFATEEVSKYDRTEGQLAEFNCNVTSKQNLSIHWLKFDQALELVSYRTIVTPDRPLWKLRLMNLLSADSGNYTCVVSNGVSTIRKTFMLNVQMRKETKKPAIIQLTPSNVSIEAGKSLTMECYTTTEFKYAVPYIQWEKRRKFFLVRNSTGNTFYKDSTGKLYPGNDIKNQFKDSKYSISYKSNGIEVVEEKQLERIFNSKLVLNSVNLDDNAVYSCIAFNDVGYSKRDVFLHVFPAPQPSRLELARLYALKYGSNVSPARQPLSVLVCLPVGLIVLLTIGFIWWREHTTRDSNKDHLTLLDIKKMREIDNFSSLEHIRDEHLDQCSSQVNKQHSLCTADGNRASPNLDEGDEHYSNADDESRQLLGNGNHQIQINNANGKQMQEKRPEYIPMRIMSPTRSDTPITGKGSTLDGHEELEWEPVDLELNISSENQNSEFLDAPV